MEVELPHSTSMRNNRPSQLACIVLSGVLNVRYGPRSGFRLFQIRIRNLSVKQPFVSRQASLGKHYPPAIAFHHHYTNYGKFLEVRDRIDPTQCFLPAWMREH